ncbi:uncharacterized protein J4E78_010798 [Alternaria triticimaculans]|uniref:uncharacterized protein n=1 Tax=Alternaria triticimaculans TaxID=297637 RepID=UPI0020C26334|nr:uncharacterized protein J4E78_010798 [Alternaria triticimaculans]KAI4639896.1 hypothetical protein J4E78_010798 [Alternaria triticimaculans]
MPSSIAEYVPAAILFSPEDVQHFTKWQEEHGVGSLPGIVRNATEYCEFLAHRRTNEESIKLKRGKVRSRNRNPATMCGHGLHPSDIITGGYCPVCEVEMCLEFLDAIAQVFQKCGGPWQQARVRNEFALVRQCWHLARYHLVELVELLECSEKYEEAWEKQHSSDVGCIWTTNSSAKAIRIAQMRMKYPAVLTEAIPRPAVKRKLSSFDVARAKVAKARVKKHVTFTPDTITWPTRSNACFNRNPEQRQSYQPGRHAAPLGLEWIDTSRMSSSIADLLNLKVYATYVQAEFDALVDDSSLRPPSRYQGILSLHPGIQAISAFANQFLQGAETAREEMLEMISVADALIVLIGEEDVVVDMHLSVSDDVEDEDGYGDEEVDQTRWTCWSECDDEAKPDVGGAAGLAAKFAVDDEKARICRKIDG